MTTALTFDVDEEMLRVLVSAMCWPDFDEFKQLCSRVRPVVRRAGKLFYMHLKQPLTTVFTVDPVLAQPAGDLVEATRIHTLHTVDTVGGYGLKFRPTMIEVFSSIPLHLREEVVAFETIGPETAEDFECQRAAFGVGWHVGITTLYRQA